MKISTIRASKLRNDEHFQFQTEFKTLVEQHTPETLDIGAAWAIYLPLYVNEEEALNIIRKSVVTDELVDADQYRDSIYRGLCDTVKGALNHFNAAVKEAANRVQVALEHYGNINTKPYDEQTAAINSLTTDLSNDYAADMATLGIDSWVTELQTANSNFENLVNERYSEDAGKPHLNMKDVRTEVDEAYNAITRRIDALIIVNGEQTYSGFVNGLNQRIKKYNNTLAQREGRNAKKETPKNEAD
ncbi:MAG: DUF6261 family protein [Draconibacterium sp.]